MAENSGGTGGGETLLFLTDEQLRKGIEAMFFAYRGFTADPTASSRVGLRAGTPPGDSTSSIAARARP